MKTSYECECKVTELANSKTKKFCGNYTTTCIQIEKNNK